MRNLRVLASLLLTRSFFWSYCKVRLRVVSKQLLFSFFVVPGRGGDAADATVVGRVSPPRRGSLVAGSRCTFRRMRCICGAGPPRGVASPFSGNSGRGLGAGDVSGVLGKSTPAPRPSGSAGLASAGFRGSGASLGLPGHGGAALLVSSESGLRIRHSPLAVVVAFRSFRVAVLCLFASVVGARVALGCLWFVVLAGVGAFPSWMRGVGTRGLDKGVPRKRDRTTGGFLRSQGPGMGWRTTLPLGWPCGTGTNGEGCRPGRGGLGRGAVGDFGRGGGESPPPRGA